MGSRDQRGGYTYARLAKRSYASFPHGLAAYMAERRLPCTCFAVMAVLMTALYADGQLYVAGSEEMQAKGGLIRRQVSHAMERLRGSGVIEPITYIDQRGVKRKDASRPGHVCRYRLTQGAMAAIAFAPPEDDDGEESES